MQAPHGDDGDSGGGAAGSGGAGSGAASGETASGKCSRLCSRCKCDRCLQECQSWHCDGQMRCFTAAGFVNSPTTAAPMALLAGE